jgi:hypothetical protein
MRRRRGSKRDRKLEDLDRDQDREYGDKPVYTNAAGDYYHRRPGADRDAVPLAAGVGYVAGRAAAFPKHKRSGSRSPTRRRERSPSSSSSSLASGRRRRRPSGRHHGNRLTEAALAAGAAGLAAHEIKKSHDRKKSEEREERRKIY